MSKWLSPPQFARQRGIRPAKVLGWIRDGELVALDLSETPGEGRPRWKIGPEAIATFDEARSSQNSSVATAPKPKPKTKQRRTTARSWIK